MFAGTEGQESPGALQVLINFDAVMLDLGPVGQRQVNFCLSTQHDGTSCTVSSSCEVKCTQNTFEHNMKLVVHLLIRNNLVKSFSIITLCEKISFFFT